MANQEALYVIVTKCVSFGKRARSSGIASDVLQIVLLVDGP